ncbi:MAG TPA: UDP-N-acetylglucosamine--N-acetylmuramyl-(pentapeptide) pyrophosphoryl-undecaprenol N-acetylglucosamine transferase [Gaiellaceae bacterium]|jgi:UDP-N-acetylglucosamine--N-acetylmuramyl-(pentapeptide) pyrophosphoryl-undecaprenol N-acetylglucosamine transferase
MPALAVAEALEKRGLEVTFAGSSERMEAELVPQAGYAFDSFRISGFSRRPGLKLARGLARASVAPFSCLRILGRRKPDVVFGGGGYVAGPMVLAAWLKRIPAALSEADAHLGLANRLAEPFARRVFLAFPIEGQEKSKYRVTGRPVPARSHPPEQAQARKHFGLPRQGPVLLVAGGSQGARALNELVVERFAESGPAILHLAGERDYPALAKRVKRPDYVMLGFTNEFGTALAACDLALARAGGSVWELAAAGKPALLVPYPYATADHQAKNANYFVEGGGALALPESELERVPATLLDLLKDPARLEKMSAAMLRLARPNAAEEIANELIELAGKRKKGRAL